MKMTEKLNQVILKAGEIASKIPPSDPRRKETMKNKDFCVEALQHLNKLNEPKKNQRRLSWRLRKRGNPGRGR